MRTLIRIVFVVLLAHLMIASPIVYKWLHDTDCRNFRVVEDGVLYRSGQLTPRRLESIISSYGIRTVVCLREGNDGLDQYEEAFVEATGRKHVRIRPRPWVPDESGVIPAEENVKAFRAVMDDKANYPVLVHCFAGIHRTGMMCAIYRIDYQGWTGAEAMAEMRTLGYSLLDEHEDVRTFLSTYLPRHTPSANTLSLRTVSRQNDTHP